MKTITSSFVACMLLAGLANAEPVALTDAQMDGVSAGAGLAIAQALSGAMGDWIADTGSYTATLTITNVPLQFAGSTASGFAISQSFMGGAAAASTSASAATLF